MRSVMARRHRSFSQLAEVTFAIAESIVTNQTVKLREFDASAEVDLRNHSAQNGRARAVDLRAARSLDNVESDSNRIYWGVVRGRRFP